MLSLFCTCRLRFESNSIELGILRMEEAFGRCRAGLDWTQSVAKEELEYRTQMSEIPNDAISAFGDYTLNRIKTIALDGNSNIDT